MMNQNSSPAEEFVAEIRSALASLHDTVALEQHPLTRRIPFIAETPHLSRGQALSRVLRRAIAALEPGPGVPLNAPEARAYQILRRHYIARQNMVKITAELNIGERHGYRELRRATESLAEIVARWASDSSSDESSTQGLDESVRREVELLARANYQEVDLAELMASVLESVQPLAAARGCALRMVTDGTEFHVTAPRVMLRQAMLNLLSHIIHGQGQESPLVRLFRSDTEALVEFSYIPLVAPEQVGPEQPYAIARQLLDSLGIPWARQDTPDGTCCVTLRIPLVQQHTVLIIDDNEGLIRLFQRYLRHQPYVVTGAHDTQDAMEAAERLQPDVIILDVMMPDQDGWEVLHALRRLESGCRARIIICSIIHDPQLADALGADAFLHKPVDQLHLLQTLEDVLAPRV